jgi:flagellar hook-associated protein 1 FlgK
MFGSGANLEGIQAIRDKFINLQITDTISRQKGSEDRYQALEGLTPIFEQGDRTGLGPLVQQFFQGFQDLSARPENMAVRTDLVSRASAMISGFQTRYAMLRDQRANADNAIATYVVNINTLTEKIADLNRRISLEPAPGADQDARDQRQEVVDQLASFMGIQTYEDEQGLLQVVAEGGVAPLVAGTHAFTLTATKDPANSNFYKVEVQSGVPFDLTQSVKNGLMGSKLALRDVEFPAIQQRLDQLAAGIQGQVNLLHRAGFGLNGVSTGVDFFQTGVPNGANGLPGPITAASNYAGMVNAWSVNAALVTDPRLIAAASVAGAVGDNTQAKALADLQFQTSSVDTNGDGVSDSGPFSTYVSSFVGYIGSRAKGFESSNTTEQNLLVALQAHRDQVSGVDLDEEAASLMTLQRGYQASARFVNVIDQLTDQLVNQFGR